MEAAELYRHDALNAYECLGCGEMIAIPRFAILQAGRRAEPVRDNPENLQLWIEMHTLDHAECAQYKDQKKARQHREFRRRVVIASRKAQAAAGRSRAV